MLYTPPEFNVTIAKESANLVLQAYQQYTSFINHTIWALQGDYTNLGELWATPEGLFTPNEPFGFVARNNESGNLFVVFRGTQSIEDWLSDLTFPQVDNPPWGKTEEGFTGLYVQCSEKVLQAVAAGAEVFVTGHSLGAALAVLAAADLAQSGRVPTMYSFAGPRVGDIDFATKFNQSLQQRAWRIVNTEDIVTTLPLASTDLFTAGIPHTPLSMLLMLTKLNYEHVGNAVCFTVNKGSIRANHAMELYIAAL